VPTCRRRNKADRATEEAGRATDEAARVVRAEVQAREERDRATGVTDKQAVSLQPLMSLDAFWQLQYDTAPYQSARKRSILGFLGFVPALSGARFALSHGAIS